MDELTLALPMIKKSRMWNRPKPMVSTASSTVNVGSGAAGKQRSVSKSVTSSLHQ